LVVGWTMCLVDVEPQEETACGMSDYRPLPTIERTCDGARRSMVDGQ